MAWRIMQVLALSLALVLQHMAVTLIALSIVRERTSGSFDRFTHEAQQIVRRFLKGEVLEAV